MAISEVQRKPAKPFLKWPGGKRWLTSYVASALGCHGYRRYFEPFLGGGAVFFALQPEVATLSDVNADLISTYIQVRYRPHDLIRRLKELPVDQATYNDLRQAEPRNQTERAVRFLYLNRTAFGGIYRLNQNGGFNVPFGGGQRTPAPLWEDGLLVNASRSLRSAEICVADFEDALAGVGPGDLVYCDPTYTVAHNNNGFVRYNERNFSWGDQRRLAALCHRLVKRRATVIVSNAANDEVLDLYRCPEVHSVSRNSTVCPRSDKRGIAKEVLLLFRSALAKSAGQI
jgi:DNA adenine methylase